MNNFITHRTGSLNICYLYCIILMMFYFVIFYCFHFIFELLFHICLTYCLSIDTVMFNLVFYLLLAKVCLNLIIHKKYIISLTYCFWYYPNYRYMYSNVIMSTFTLTYRITCNVVTYLTVDIDFISTVLYRPYHTNYHFQRSLVSIVRYINMTLYNFKCNHFCLDGVIR